MSILLKIIAFLFSLIAWPISFGAGFIYLIQKAKLGSRDKTRLSTIVVTVCVTLSIWWFPILVGRSPISSPIPAILGEVGIGEDELNFSDRFEIEEIVKVVDGDTLDIIVEGEELRVRLIGINTPEIAHEDSPEQCYGEEAKERTAELVRSARSAYLELDETQGRTDKYERVLGYIFLDDNNLAKDLISDGFGREYTYGQAYKYRDKFILSEEAAQAVNKGMWGSACTCERKELNRACSTCGKSLVTYQGWDCNPYSKIEEDLNCRELCN